MTPSGISEATTGHTSERRRSQIAVGVVAALVVFVGAIGAAVKHTESLPLGNTALGFHGQNGPMLSAVGNRIAPDTDPPPGTDAPPTTDAATTTASTSNAATSHTHMTMRISSGSEGSATITFDMDNDPANRRSSMVERGDGFNRDIKMIGVGNVVYLSRADGSWARVELGDAIRDRAIANLAPTEGSIANLQHLGANLTQQGKARVDGVVTTQWSGPIDMEKYLAASGALMGFDIDADQLEEIAKSSEGTANAYVDDRDHLRRMTLDLTMRVPDQPPLHMVEESRSSKWGEPVHIDEPEASEVTRDEHVDSMPEWLRIVSEEVESQTA